MEVLEINRTKTLAMGITWPSTFTVLPSGSVLLSDLPFGPGHSLDSSDISINTNLIATLKQDNSLSNLISNPRIRVRNRDKARVLIGNREPVITSQVTPGATNPIVTESVQYLDIGVKLEIEPTILLDDDVAMKINLEVSSKGPNVTSAQGNTYFAVNTRTVNTVLRLRDGETALMMGFIQDDSVDSRSGIPGLTDLPILSKLFSNGTTGWTKGEIVFSVTPRVVRNLKRLEASSTEFWSGTESSLRTKAPILSAVPGATLPGAAAPAGPRSGAAPPGAAAPAAAVPAAPAGAEAPTVLTAPEAQAPAATAAVPAPSAPSGEPMLLSFTGPAEANVGNEIKVTLDASAPDPLSAIGVVLRFDPAILQAVKVEEGTLLRQGGAATAFTQNVNPASGRVVANIKREGNTGAKGSGSLITVTFKVIGNSDQAQIQVLSASPTSQAGTPIRIQVSGPHPIALGQ
ncbi:MAG TPA: cohesin domain-containing protein, partial [Burkholderiales bacterium]